jgi:hypothetical protein
MRSGLVIATRENVAKARHELSQRKGERVALAKDNAPIAQPEDDTLAKLVKLIPGEVVAFYLSISAFLADTETGYRFAVFLIGLIATPAIVWLSAHPAEGGVKLRPPLLQYVLRTVAFVLWAMVTAYPFRLFGDPIPAQAVGIALAVFTLFSPFAIRDGAVPAPDPA